MVIFLFIKKFYSSPIATRKPLKHTAIKRNGCETTADPRADTIDSVVHHFLKGSIMKANVISSIALAVAALSAGHAFAADVDAPLTREQVRAEFVRAQQAGEVIGDNESGLTLREMYPSRYPAVTAQAKSRAEVKAELAQAQRDGNVIADNESGRTAREINPSAYAAAPKGHMLTREEVRAELRAAQQSGDVIADVESGRTAREMYPNRYPKDIIAQGKTREQVKAELAEAQRTGDIIADGESGKKLNELFPNRYPKN